MAAAMRDGVALRARAIRLLTCDVDGVLTDGRLYYGDDGSEMKAFSALDGVGHQDARARRHRRRVDHRQQRAVGRAPRARARRRAARAGRRGQARAVGSAARELGARRPPPARTSATTCRTCRSSPAAASASASRTRRRRCASARITSRARDGGAGAVREVCELILAAQDALAPQHRGVRRLTESDEWIRKRALIDRLVSWSPVFLLGGLAALTYWLDAQIQADTARRDGTARHDADMYIENFRAVSFDADGRVRQSLSAQRAEHHPDDESVDFTAPVARADRSGPPAHVDHRDAGTLSGDRETVTFRGNVRATRDALPDGGPTSERPKGPITLTTETLRVDPEEGRAETDGPVTVEEPRGIIHAIGMVVDNEAQTIKLKSGVRGTLSPEIAPK